MGTQKLVAKPDPKIDRLWLDEAERRLTAYRAGKVQDVPTIPYETAVMVFPESL